MACQNTNLIYLSFAMPSSHLIKSYINILSVASQTSFSKNPCSVQLSFQMWTNQIQETLNSKKRGDTAFRAKDFTTAIECYTQVSDLSETIFFSTGNAVKKTSPWDL